MGAKWERGVDPEVVLQRYKSQCSLNEDNALQFSGLEFIETEALLHEQIDYGAEYGFSVSKGFREKALLEWFRKGVLTPGSFMKELNKQISIYNQTKVIGYSFVSTISVAGGVPSRFKLPGVDVRIYKEVPKKYSSRSGHYERWESLHPGMKAVPDGHSIVVAYVKEKHKDEAVRKAIDGIDFVRGLMGMTLNKGMAYTLGSHIKRHEPINKVLLGGLHTLHFASGKDVTKEFWYEPGYSEVTPFFVEGLRKGILAKNMGIVISGVLNASENDSKLLYSSILNYTRALDEADPDVALIRLWAAFEPLIGKNCSDVSGAIVRRCSFIFLEGKYVSELLECIRRYRNGSVHRGVTNESAQIYCYQLQNILRGVLYFYINSLGGLTSIDEVNEFLDLPADLEMLSTEIEKARRRVWLARKALRFRTPEKT
ncbi:hypothetical protein [Metapseudomonas otitidis]|uniref:hypothetical protein n=1 Tax=Metapseudomonas otitidis TaxID=319939 RepID=UPI001CA43F12|nr:hypothetical protein [Pseudomonas otitidis]QZX85315.1 hypothetical protein K6751_11630 [Pseudomonas otitidis]